MEKQVRGSDGKWRTASYVDSRYCECECKHSRLEGPDKGHDCTDTYCGYCDSKLT